MSDKTKRKIEVTVFTDKLISEKIYSDESNPKTRNEKPSLEIHKDECSSFRANGELCDREHCFNKSFFKRLEEYNFSDREKFINYQISIRKDKLKFVEELSKALYDCQALFESHVYRHYLEIIKVQRKEIKKEMGIINTAHELGNRVFIIHGHDDEMKKATQLFVNRIGLEDVVLHEQPNRGRTIIRKLLEESNGACFALALFSPDDKVESGKARARQNVILELGYFIGLIGAERVRILKKGVVEIPSDLQGVIYEDYDTNGNWQIKLLKEMEDVGIELDKEKILKKF